jgi:hypothetical protein
MTSTSYYSHICDGLFDPKQKTTSLDRVALLPATNGTAPHVAPFALGLHKGTGGFTATQLTGKDTIHRFLPPNTDFSHRHVVLGDNKILCVVRGAPPKKGASSSNVDSVIIFGLASKSARSVKGIHGRVQDLIPVPGGVVVVGDSKFFWLSEQSAYRIFPFQCPAQKFSLPSLAAVLPNTWRNKTAVFFCLFRLHFSPKHRVCASPSASALAFRCNPASHDLCN